jgi:glucokinase
MAKRQTAVVAVDLGGTNFRLALVSSDGKILGRREGATASMLTQQELVATLAARLKDCAGDARAQGFEVAGVGVGVPGRLLAHEGRIIFSPNIRLLDNLDLVAQLQNLIELPVFLENDANLFALGEHWRGAGRGYRQMLGITLGTGVGGGLILNNKLWPGAEGVAAEIGHITIEPDGRKCNCGSRGCLETLASGSWAVAWVKEQLSQGAASWLRELWETAPEDITGETLVTAAQQGDPLGLKVFERVGRSLGQAIGTVVHLLGVSRVVIGGRFARAWDLFMPALTGELHRRLTMFPPGAVSLAPAQLGDDAGLMGAARLAWEAGQPK